jgi:uncharacterized protein
VCNYFIFDTNALISAHLKEGTTSALAFHKGLTQGVIVVSDDTLREFATRFARKKFDKYISTADRAEAIIKLSRDCLLVNPTIAIKACRDLICFYRWPRPLMPHVLLLETSTYSPFIHFEA